VVLVGLAELRAKVRLSVSLYKADKVAQLRVRLRVFNPQAARGLLRLLVEKGQVLTMLVMEYRQLQIQVQAVAELRLK
jgi:hypothetical protein